jgi:hypothetical protein
MNGDLVRDNLHSSISLFTEDSIESRNPVPRDLEVYALLSGLSFELPIKNSLSTIQDAVTGIIRGSLHYWVRPENLGLEFCVFKWPGQEWDESRLEGIRGILSELEAKKFNFEVHGIQLNPDGCLIAKGYDEGGRIFDIRRYLKHEVPNLPTRQSEWAHIPLGRLLEPVGESTFRELADYIYSMSGRYIASQLITSVKLVHETRWYMERHEVLSEYALY